VTNQGDVALKYASQYLPSAILLDIQLAVLDGWTVLKKLKEDKSLSHIPVHVMSASDKGSLGIKFGALTYLRKPLDKHQMDKAFLDIENSVGDATKNLLIVGSPGKSISVHDFIDGTFNCKCIEVTTVDQAKSILHSKEHFDSLMVILNEENDWTAMKDLISWTKSKIYLEKLPIIVCGESILTVEQKIFLNEHDGISTCEPSKEDARRVLLEILSRGIVSQEEGIESGDPIDEINPLKGRTVLISDDDMRNTYSISAILEEKEMNVIIAGNGVEAIRKLEDNPSIEIILLDVMMPEMDGYEVLAKINQDKRWNQIPVIALSANALSTTRDKCMALGASEYLTKPINVEQLVNLLEVWLND
jgi:CheY-like chemotaxis protein